MESFGRACDEFAMEHNRYPGLLPDASVGGATFGGVTITSAQNALLELMGGARVKNNQSPNSVVEEYDSFADDATVELTVSDPVTNLNWSLAFDENKFGEGPWITGRMYTPYFSPKSNDLSYPTSDISSPNFRFPSIIDAWETPIIYMRSGRNSGPIIDSAENGLMPQFDRPIISTHLDDPLNANASILGDNYSADDQIRNAWLTVLLSHPTFWEIDEINANSEFSKGVAWGTVKGRYVLISAGVDKIFLEIANKKMHVDQVIDPNDPSSSLLEPDSGKVTPTMMESFNDVVVFGGGS